jgi:hypothetical protein
MPFQSLLRRLLAVAVLGVAASAAALTPQALQQELAAAAKQEDAGFAGFSVERGRAFFTATHGREWSCSSCHGNNPLAPGRHARTGKTIGALAPAGNAERFTDQASVEKWFKRNCGDVVGRACTAREKGDVLAFLLTVK